MTSKKEIEQYFALGKKIRQDIIRVSEAMASNGFSVIPGNLIGYKFDLDLVPAGTECDDIVCLDDTFSDDSHDTFEANTLDSDGDRCTWTVPTAFLGLSDKALEKKAEEIKEAEKKRNEKEMEAARRRQRREAKKAEQEEYELYMKLDAKYGGRKK